ncbi:MAG: tRNA pseudouridine(55) synthase TruB, partial [Thiovulaceae bacterium]|nr:tRNA pseudouridine(55) synthase TruB [Sulfurimonadaceae bacterium]
AFGKYTSLFRFLNKTPKSYRATLWLGAHSDTLDTEAVSQIDTLEPLDQKKIEEAVESLQGELEYYPPIFSAKKIDGRRAYDLAREGKEVKLNPIHSIIYDIKLVHYCHPFVTFEATVSEGTYIRSLGRLIAEKLGVSGSSLSSLDRLHEGQFHFDNEKALDIKKSLNIPQNVYTQETDTILLGQKLDRRDFKIADNGTYWVDNGKSISIFEFDDEGVHYLLNRVSLHEEL